MYEHGTNRADAVECFEDLRSGRSATDVASPAAGTAGELIGGLLHHRLGEAQPREHAARALLEILVRGALQGLVDMREPEGGEGTCVNFRSAEHTVHNNSRSGLWVSLLAVESSQAESAFPS